jgi:SSS family solute:Na+ symporter
MTPLDWIIVLVLNGAVIGYGLYLARGTSTSGEWFLARRALPWWAVGLSMFATNVDSADLVGVTGQTYNEGLHVISVYAVGSAAGGILAAFWLVPSIARQGLYTNSEYLEARFGPTTRVLSALIQVQYRTSMLGMIINSTHIMLTSLVQIPPGAAWWLIAALVVLAGLYTAWGGLKSVVWTDAAQGVVMMVAALIIFTVVWKAVGGWSGLESRLAAGGAVKERPLADWTHIGRYYGESGSVSPWLVVVGWVIIGSGYWTVNHTQTMRLMGSRSYLDMKLAALFGVALSLPVMVVSALLGAMGRAIPRYSALEDPDKLYPLLANAYLGPGLKGLVVAGVVAAVVSTFDSMGSALSAIFTRDVYARLIAPDRADRHYVLVGRLATVGVLLLGFAYLPFIAAKENMLKAFTTLIPVFVTPLFTIYLAGVFTRAHRKSGAIGLLFGAAYGVLALSAREVYFQEWWFGLPAWTWDWMPTGLTDQWVALSWSMLFTAVPMAVATAVLGPAREDELPAVEERGWLGRSREELPPLPDRTASPWIHPAWLAVGLLIVTAWVTFGLFW